MTKKSKKDVVLENLKGFVRLGASTNSPGNVPTGHFNLDFAIHYGMLPKDADFSELKDYDPSVPLGVPRGKLIEIFGEEGGGKSSLAYRIIGFAQKMGFEVAWIDAENSFSSSLAKINGVDENTIYYADMSNEENEETIYYAEDIFDAVVNLCKNGIKVIVVDSVASMVPKVVMDSGAEQQTMGLMARLFSSNLGKIVNFAAKYGALVIFINQLREKIGVKWGSPDTSPGGHALKHLASLRIKMTKRGGKEANIEVEDEKGETKIVGRNSIVRLEKNRFAKPLFESIDVPIYYEPYFPEIEDLLFDSGRQLKVISVRTGIFKWQELAIEGKKNFIEKIKSDSLQESLYKDLFVKAKEVNSFLPPEITQWANEKKIKAEYVKSSTVTDPGDFGDTEQEKDNNPGSGEGEDS